MQWKMEEKFWYGIWIIKVWNGIEILLMEWKEFSIFIALHFPYLLTLILF